uniref:Maltose excess protein 1, chloroplastic n=1 Tax=Noccaea caerulescens TaxID=107243 RepID=A0A1J3HNJ2_NOCCA
MESKTIATSLGGDRLLIIPSCPRSSFISTTRCSRLPQKRASIGGGAVSASGVNGYRGLSLTRWNPIVSTRRLVPVRAIESDLPHPTQQGSSGLGKIREYEEWDSWTAKFSGGANIPFLMLQLPQIILNAQNLLAGNNTALSAVPWLGMLTGLLGNLSLLSYFAKKREKEAAVVQTLGVISTYIVLAQLTIAEAMPLKYFVATSGVVTIGLILNCLFYFDKLSRTLWRLWEDFITIGGLSVLPQIMWSTFVPLVPDSILPGATAFVIALAAVIMARTGKLSEKGLRFFASLSGWTATLMFMWMPVSQMWTNFLNPDNIKGLSPITMVLAMMGNGLMIPRALFIRDLMWFTGSMWATLFYGYGNILCLYMFNCTSKSFFAAATIGLISWIGLALWRDAMAYGHNSPLRSLKELVFGP